MVPRLVYLVRIVGALQGADDQAHKPVVTAAQKILGSGTSSMAEMQLRAPPLQRPRYQPTLGIAQRSRAPVCQCSDRDGHDLSPGIPPAPLLSAAPVRST
jgi:hypothetical protein